MTTKMKMIRTLMGAACVVAMLPLAAMAETDKPVIGVAVADQKSLFYGAAVDGMKSATEKAGYKLVITSANNDPVEQVNQVQNLLVQQIGVLVFISQDSTAAAAGVKAANAAGVPVIAVEDRKSTRLNSSHQ